MPQPGQCWWHLCLHTLGSWLHGDPRGFRDRAHRIHSSGDYSDPPPELEHAGLHVYMLQRSRKVELPGELWPRVGEAIRQKCEREELRLLIVSVESTHAHLLVEYDDDYKRTKRFMGRLKQAASHAVKDVLPGTIWAREGKPVRLKDRAHLLAAFRYILAHREHGAFVWTFDERFLT